MQTPAPSFVLSMSLCASVLACKPADAPPSGDSKAAAKGEAKREAEAEPAALAAAPTKTADAAACAAGERAITVTNGCSETVWIGATSATIACKQDSDCPSASSTCKFVNPTDAQGFCTCSAAADCGTIGQCNTDSKACFWNSPTAATLELAAAGAGTSSTTLCVPAGPSSSGIQWSGNVFARTGCKSDGTGCLTADCGNTANQPCPTFKGGTPPATLAEFTLANPPTSKNKDFYDVTVINGINVGVAMGPNAGSFSADADDPYSCATAGAVSQPGSLSGCPWTVSTTVAGTDYATLLTRVLPCSTNGDPNFPSCNSGQLCPDQSAPNSLGHCACTATTDCGAGMVCGTAQNAEAGQVFAQVCGTAAGWWSANQICQTDPSFADPIDCATTFTNNDGSTSTKTQLFACTGRQGNSCYNQGDVAAVGDDCCGCATDSANPLAADWPSVLAVNDQCFANNTNWAGAIQAWLLPLKQACPTAYTYPFDDATATFTCYGSAGTSPSYTIEFCPGA